MSEVKTLDQVRHHAYAHLLMAHSTLLKSIDSKLVQADLLPIEWYDVLLGLDMAQDSRLRMHELAEVALLSRSGLTRLVDRLERAGYLTREVCPSDRRGSFAVLTDAGRAALRSTWPTYAQAIQEHFGQHLSDEEAKILNAALIRLTEVNGGKPITSGSCGS